VSLGLAVCSDEHDVDDETLIVVTVGTDR